MRTKKYIITISCLIMLVILSGTCIGEEIDINQDVNKLDKNKNGKILSAEKVNFSDAYFKYKDSKRPSSLDKTNIYKIKYLSEGLEVVGFIVRPKKKGDYPVIIFNRGGNEEYAKITNSLQVFFSRLAAKGYVIVASQYRGNDGGEGKEEFGGKDVNDVLNLVPLIKSLDFTLSDKIGMLGISRGGMMSYIAIKKGIDVDAAVVIGGVTDLIQNYKTRSAMKQVMNSLIGCTPQECRKEYIKRSAYYWPEKIDVPVLILHGTKDWNVKVSQAKKLAKKLNELDKEYKLVLYDDKHGLGKHHEEWKKEMWNWFDKHLN